MINGLEGIPGSGKSYEMVTYHVLHALKAGRKVITNLPLQVEQFALLDPAYSDLIQLRHKSSPLLGTWDAARVDEKGNGLAFELETPGLQLLQKPVVDNGVFGSVWDYYTTWKHPTTGQGPLFVIDECHTSMPKIGIDPQVVEWFKLHRHFNCDVLLATQNFRDVNQPIANLIAMLVKVRSADVLTGKKDSYIRKVHAGFRGAAISSEIRKYQTQYFALYKSHSQGNSVAESSASDVSPMLVKFKRFSRIFYLITAVYCVWAVYQWFQPKPISTKPSILGTAAVGALAAAKDSPVVPIVSVAATPADSQKMQPTPVDEIPEPYASKGLHLTGRMTFGQKVLYTFAVSNSNTRLGQVTSDDLKSVGYVWQPLTDCSGTLRWKGNAKAITCDAPAVAEGSSGAPVVITVPAGSTTQTARSDGLPVGGSTSMSNATKSTTSGTT